MMITNSVATSRQPKSALMASRTPCTWSRIAKGRRIQTSGLGPSCRIPSGGLQVGDGSDRRGLQRLALADVFVDQRDDGRVAPGERRYRQRRLRVWVELLGEDPTGERR